MSRELTDLLLSNADFGEHEVVDDSGAESSVSSGITLISKPIFFNNAFDEDADSECVSMEIRVNEDSKTVEVEHPYANNIGELESLAKERLFN